MTEGDFFRNDKKGEIFELRQELRSDKREKKKEALKRIISYITAGRDMSELFSDIVNMVQTDNAELKKLVYLYLINYSRTHPDLALLAVNSFVRDCEDTNPLVRALAVRTMGAIRVANIAEYLCEPLRKCLNDEDPYVRKTATICVLKLFRINPELVSEQGFIKKLISLLSDPNPMVISNALSSLMEISNNISDKSIFEITSDLVNKLLVALNECNEWGQITILDSLITYNPSSELEAKNICERITSRLSHANSALVLGTIKVLLKNLKYINEENTFIKQTMRKMGPPLVTMLSLESEIQYVALRNINLICQKYPEILRNELKYFFVKYNDPIYIKLEKLGIIIKLVTEENVTQVLSELREYASEVDVDFVRKSVRAIGSCALLIESAADSCVSTLLELIQTKVAYVVQESIIIAKDIMRRFPNRFESIISKLCENLETLDDPEARSGLIWIIGEYSHIIENASELLRAFVENFNEEPSIVQLQVLTAVVKLFLKEPANNQDLVQDVLTMVTQGCDNPDVRDRGYVYWRLLSADPESAKKVVLSDKSLICSQIETYDENLLDELLLNLSSLSSVYHKLPQTLVDCTLMFKHNVENKVLSRSGTIGSDVQGVGITVDKAKSGDELIDLNFEPCQYMQDASPNKAEPIIFDANVFNSIEENLKEVENIQQSSYQRRRQSVTLNLLSLLPSQNIIFNPPQTTWASHVKCKGLEIVGGFVYQNDKIFACITLTNYALIGLSDFLMQLNKNYFGISITNMVSYPALLAPKQSVLLNIELGFIDTAIKSNDIDIIQVAIKNNIDVFYFSVCFPIHFYLYSYKSLEISTSEYLMLWSSISESKSSECKIPNPRLLDDGKLRLKLNSLNILYISLDETNNPSLNELHGGYCRFLNDSVALLQVCLVDISAKIIVRSENYEIVAPLLKIILQCFDTVY